MNIIKIIKRKINKELLIQLIFLIILLIISFIILNNLYFNLQVNGIGFKFNWLTQPSGFAISENSLNYTTSDNYLLALINGFINSLKVIIFSLLIATTIGFTIGLSSISNNIIIKYFSRIYIIIIRQTPLLLQLMFWYFIGILSIKESTLKLTNTYLSISNQGIIIFGAYLTPEFSSLLIGLSIFSGAYISEVVRGGIISVSRGQWEAFQSLGLSPLDGLKNIIIPQALPAIIPGLTSQYLNLTKNSTLAIAVGYADIYAISDTIINQTGRSIEGFIILILFFLLLNLIISKLMGLFNNIILKLQRR